MLNISLLKLMSGTEEKMSADESGFCVNERHGVLQLVAKTESTAGLVVPAPGPKTTCQRLVDKPAICQHVEGLIRRFDLYGAERAVPVVPNPFECERAAAGPRKRRTSFAASSASRPEPSMKMTSCSCPSARSKGT